MFNSDFNKKVCLIVDHPVRDLPGLLYLVCKLKKKKISYYLVPFYNFREIYLIKPNLVILNHSRNIYKNFIKILNLLNINIIVLDTEGGMVTKDLIDEYILFSNLNNNINNIKKYCLWSREIKKNLLKKIRVDHSKFIVTGNPRYQFIRLNKKKLGKNILVNLNFATINPKFQTVNDEKNLLVKQGKTTQWINGYINHQKKMREKFIFLINQLSETFSLNEIIVRPHPYEDLNYYKDIFKNKKNLVISSGENICDDINQSCVVIQNNCGTTIDASLLNCPVISYCPFKSEYLDQKFILDISTVCKSEYKVKRMIKLIYNGKYHCKNYLTLINDNFSYLKNSSKLFDRLIGKLITNQVYKKNLLILLIKNYELIFFFRAILKLALGKMLFSLLNKNFKIKIFSSKKVKEILNRLFILDKKLNKNIHVQKISIMSLIKFYSIKIN